MARSHTAYWAFGLLLLLATCAFAYDSDSDSEYSGKKEYSGKDEYSGKEAYSGKEDYSGKEYYSGKDEYSGKEEYSGKDEDKEEPADNDVCDPAKQTQSPRFVIRWKNRPHNCQGFFKKFGIELTMLYEWDKEASIYEAEDTKEANDIMDDILTILSGDELTGKGPFADPEIQHAIKAHVASVYGECFYEVVAAKPAAAADECPGATCPTTGLWGLNRIRAPATWALLPPGIANQSPTSNVMVIDSGVNQFHQDLAANLVPGLTVTGYVFPPTPVAAPGAVGPTTDPNGHGTHVSGTIFARWNNGVNTPVGVVGNALGGSCGCDNRTPPDGRPGTLEGLCLLNCLRFAGDRGVRVINMSYGRRQPQRSAANDEERLAMIRFCNQGGIAAIAAGNDGRNILEAGRFTYPAALAADLANSNPTCIIPVANLQENGELSASSNFGAAVKVAAPGTAIFSAWNGSPTDTQTISGTSMASPHVAGMATLLFNAFPDATQPQVHNCIVNTATNRARANPAVAGQTIAGGIVDLLAAYNCVLGNPTCPTTGLPPCVNPTTGRVVTPVAACVPANNFCLQIPGNTRAICQYNYRAEGSLCRLDSTAGTNDFDDMFEELSAEEMQTLGLSAAPTEYLEEDTESQANMLGGSEPQQALPRRQKRTCGSCVNRQCVTQTARWCKTARRAPRATTSADPTV